MTLIITFVILIFSAIVHEVSHGLAAEKLGDDTARQMGRITLNPIPHIDLYGTILLPAFMWFATGGRFFFGAAKPVPVDFTRLRHPKRDMALVSLAGPFANFALAVLMVIPIKLHLTNNISYPILLIGIFINIILGTFNLIPIPPLDGSKVLVALAPESWMYKILSLERYGFLLVIVFVVLGLFSYILWPVVLGFFQLFHLSLGDLISALA
ncbi:MAG: site-2 protease family protein [Patescibacteria group bacterium]|nr:site-2 protease family protein [Patescibacteria group bacterium]